MSFPFYPKHEYGCPHVRHCPHAGGAAIGHLVQLAGDHQDCYQGLYRQIDSERERNSKLFAENQQLAKKIEQLQLELRLERQNKFATHKQKAELAQTESAETPARKKGQRGAPKGHAPWYRRMPTGYDVRVDVEAPKRCPRCDSRSVAVYFNQAATEHLQEDIVDGRYHVTLFTHPSARLRSKCSESLNSTKQTGVSSTGEKIQG